jgi:hypothetical protein
MQCRFNQALAKYAEYICNWEVYVLTALFCTPLASYVIRTTTLTLYPTSCFSDWHDASSQGAKAEIDAVCIFRTIHIPDRPVPEAPKVGHRTDWNVSGGKIRYGLSGTRTTDSLQSGYALTLPTATSPLPCNFGTKENSVAAQAKCSVVRIIMKNLISWDIPPCRSLKVN